MKNIQEYLTRMTTQAETDIMNFRANLAENPAYAFKNAESTVRAAAQINVWRTVAEILERQPSADLIRIATSNALRIAGHPSRSSSAMHNMVEMAEGEAWITLLEAL